MRNFRDARERRDARFSRLARFIPLARAPPTRASFDSSACYRLRARLAVTCKVLM